MRGVEKIHQKLIFYVEAGAGHAAMFEVATALQRDLVGV